MKNRSNALALVLCLLAVGCTTPEDSNAWKRYWYEETGKIPTKDITGLYSSPYAKDYIQSDGTGTAIPAKMAYDIYISPFAPTRGYISSKEPEGTMVICPFTGRRLTLGSRNQIKEHELSR